MKNNILDELEKYMLYDINIINRNENNNINKEKLNKIFENKLISNSKDNKINTNTFKENSNNNFKHNNNNNKNFKENSNNNIFIPKNNDKLFWCLYILKYGLNNYNLNNNFTTEKKIKIDVIKYMKENKLNIKIKKIELENNLLYEKKMSIQSLVVLSNYLKINIKLIYDKYYYEFLNSDENIYYGIYNINSNFGINIINDKTINLEDKMLILNYNKPINSLSYYKIDDLYEIAKKLKIEILEPNSKKKLKKDIYDEIYKVFYN